MFGNINYQLIYIKILYVIVVIDIDFSDDFLSTGLELFERNNDTISNIFVSDDSSKGGNIIDTDLDWGVDKID
jgi:hypothetical protein